MLQLGEVTLDVFNDLGGLTFFIEHGRALGVAQQGAGLIHADHKAVFFRALAQRKGVTADHGRNVGRIPCAIGTYKQVFTWLQAHQHHRTKAVVGLVFQKHDGVGGRRPGELVHGHVGNVKASSVVKLRGAADFLVAVALQGNRNYLFKHFQIP